jgi:hypothetical protein
VRSVVASTIETTVNAAVVVQVPIRARRADACAVGGRA